MSDMELYRIGASEGTYPLGAYDFYLYYVTTWNLEGTIIVEVVHIVHLVHSQLRPILLPSTSAIMKSEI